MRTGDLGEAAGLRAVCVYVGPIRLDDGDALVAVMLGVEGDRRVLACQRILRGIVGSAERLAVELRDKIADDCRPLFVVRQPVGLVSSIRRMFGREQPIQQCRTKTEEAILRALPFKSRKSARSKLRRIWFDGDLSGLEQLVERVRSSGSDTGGWVTQLGSDLRLCFTVNRLGIEHPTVSYLATTAVLERLEKSINRKLRRAQANANRVNAVQVLMNTTLRRLNAPEDLSEFANGMPADRGEQQSLTMGSNSEVQEAQVSIESEAQAKSATLTVQPSLQPAPDNLGLLSMETALELIRRTRAPLARSVHFSARSGAAALRLIRRAPGPVVRSAGQLARKVPGSIRRARAFYQRAARPDPIFAQLRAREESNLVDRLFLLPAQNAPKSVIFLGVDRGAPYGGLCATAGELLARRLSAKVCVVDASLGGLGLDDALGGSDDGGGLCSALREPTRCAEWAQPHESLKNLWILPRGDVRGLDDVDLTWDRIQELVRNLQTCFEYLIFHAPPLPGLLDGVLLGSITDGVVLVVEAGETRDTGLRQAAKNLAAASVPVLAAVVTGRKFSIPQFIYGRLFGHGSLGGRSATA